MSGSCLIEIERKKYHTALLSSGVLCLSHRGGNKGKSTNLVPSNADGSSSASIEIARAIFEQLQSRSRIQGRLAGQIAGSKFEQITRSFVARTFGALEVLRPGKWDFDPERRDISRYEQYRHLAELSDAAVKNPEIAVLLGKDYIIAPDVLVVRYPEPDEAINSKRVVVDDTVARCADLRARNNKLPILHASISCKWTLRSDRAQNARSEALNLMRNRKGKLPHIMVVTGEPLPSRLASIALGTGDIDCVYHFALPELVASVDQQQGEDSIHLVRIMVEGKRLKDITDLPLDLAV